MCFIYIQLVGRYQVNAEEKEKEAVTAQGKLNNLRKMVAQLLSTLHDTQVRSSFVPHYH